MPCEILSDRKRFSGAQHSVKSHLLLSFIFILAIAILTSADSVAAQSDESAYWRYDAPDRINHLETSDVDLDGIDELVIVAGDTEVVLVGADGISRWSVPYHASTNVNDLVMLDLDGDEDGTREIALVTEQDLHALDNSGSEIFTVQFRDQPVAIEAISSEDGHPHDMIVAFSGGELRRIDNQGRTVWQRTFNDANAQDAKLRIIVEDLSLNGTDEVIASYFTDEGFSKLVLMNQEGEIQWERSNSGSVTALTTVQFEPGLPSEIAIGTTLNRIHLYTLQGERRWPYRSPNKPITALSTAMLDDLPALIVGTSVGKVIAYDQIGRRIWEDSYNSLPDRPILSISAREFSDLSSSPASLAILLGHPSDTTEENDIILLDTGGRRLEPSFPAIDYSALSRLVDLNHDGISELLVAGFATVELLDPGIGARQYSSAWDYRLGASPQSFLVTDIDQDNEEELLIGTDDGSLHVLRKNGTLLWTAGIGGVVSEIAVAESDVGQPPLIVAVHNDSSISEGGVPTLSGWLEVLDSESVPIWSEPLPSSITALATWDINRSGPKEIIIGTSDGEIRSYSLLGDEFWRTSLTASVDNLTFINVEGGVDVLVSTGANNLDRLDNKGVHLARTAEFLEDIVSVHELTKDPELVSVVVVAVEDGTLRGISPRGNQLWQVELPGSPVITHVADNSILVGTDENQLLRVDADGEIILRMTDPGPITSLYSGDLDGDIQTDIAIGNRTGDVKLIAADNARLWDELNLDSEVANLSAARGLPTLQAELVAVTDNGIVQLFKSRSNKPPLLVNPRTEVDEGQYSISVSVVNLENDQVAVTLEIYDPDLQQWEPVDTKVATGGRNSLFWPVDPARESTEVQYRFRYDDGSHSGLVEPTVGPAVIPPAPILRDVLIMLVFAAIGLSGATLYLRQARSPASRARRFYARLKQRPEQTLELLDAEFSRTDGSPYFLLNLANAARQDENPALSSLADGLYLLDSRPESALRIIVGALEDAREAERWWFGFDAWMQLFRTSLSLITAPSILELSLLRSQLEQYLRQEEQYGPDRMVMDGLLSVLNTLRDSERVDLVEDRLIYLNEAVGLVKQLQHQSAQLPIQIETAILRAIIYRWLGLIRADIEEMHGRAQLVIELLTKHLVPEEEPVVAIEITNTGRAPAEQVVVTLQANPTYTKVTKSQLIPILSPGRKRQVTFTVDPDVREAFRIVFSIAYDDRQRAGQMLDFADMVHLLPPVKDFKPIANPYSPGMPLRRNSLVFYGREDLFDFIRENAGQGSQHNVLILIGQRRTGKTSALLQLDEHLPATLFPIYIDCQSLGVSPGMPAFFHDLAWTIAETLSAKGLEMPVPKPVDWKVDPAGKFQRKFIPEIQRLLPEGTTILLVFDEFEAFENLVRDGVLPRTLFTFLRHLMQHSQGLSFVFAGTHRLEEMGSDYWSVLFNIALYRHIGYLNNESARRLICDPVAPHIIYDDLAVNKILRVTSGHPYFMQLVCYSLVNRANSGRKAYVTISDVNASLDEMLRLGEVHFAYLWQRSTFTERALLAAASRRGEGDAAFRPTELVQFLTQYGIYLEAAEVISGLNRLVEREIMSEISDEGTQYYELRIGLVGLWVARNKSISRLYEKRDVMDLVPSRSNQ